MWILGKKIRLDILRHPVMGPVKTMILIKKITSSLEP